VEGDDYIDMNRVFDYAGSYLEDLKQIHIFIPESAIITYRSGMFVTLKFEWHYLQRFLEKRQLHAFGLHFCRRYPHLVRAMTNGGRALISLCTHQSLHTLLLSHLHFDNVSDFVSMLSGHRNGQSLRYLEIGDLSVGLDRNLGLGSLSLWSLIDAKTIASAIKDLVTLEHLHLSEMEDQCLEGRDDNVLAVLLSNKPNLRFFGIGALEPWQLKLYGRSNKGSVTDRSIEIIVNKVGSTVQELVFANQRQITPAGLETILRGCPLLRSLKMVGLELTVEELERLLPLSSTLLYFVFGKGPPFTKREENLEQWIPAVLATEGRTILCPGRDEVPVDEGKLPPAYVENAKHSKELLAKSHALYEDAEAEATNMWGFLL